MPAPGPIAAGRALPSPPGAEARARFAASVRRRRLISTVVLVVLGLLLAGSATLVVLAAWALVVVQALGHAFGLVIATLLLAPFGGAPYDTELPGVNAWLLPIVGYVAFFVVPLLGALPIVLPTALRWRDPKRIVVFRRFNAAYENRQLRRIVSRHLAVFGHLFTLADREIHIPLGVRIPVLLGQLGFTHFRPIVVRDAAGLARLKAVLQRRWRLNVNWLVSRRKIFAVRSADAQWQACVQTLLDGADLAVMDISQPRDFLAWEIAEVRRHGLRDRLVFLADADARDAALRWLATQPGFGAGAGAPPLFTYTRRGLDEPARLHEHLLDVLAATGAPRGQPSALEVATESAVALVVSAALAGAAAVLAAPYAFPDLAARHSPLAVQVLHAWLYGDSREALPRLARDFDATAAATLAAWLSHPVPGMRLKARQGLEAIGDARALAPLVQAAAAGPDAPEAKRVLAAVAKRLGPRAVQPLLEAAARTPGLAYEPEIFEPLRAHDAQLPRAQLLAWLDAPGQAVRWHAALVLAPEGDLRTAAALLEMLLWTRPGRVFDLSTWRSRDEAVAPLARQARAHLDALLERDLRALTTPERRALARFLPLDHEAAAYAAQLALKAGAEDDVAQALAAATALQGQPLLRLLLRQLEAADATAAAAARQPSPAAAASAAAERTAATRAERLLRAARRDWLLALAAPAQAPRQRLDAAQALALRGDAAALAPALELGAIEGRCRFLDFRTACHTYEDDVYRIVDLLAARWRPGGALPDTSGALRELPPHLLLPLARLLRRAGDERALRSLVRAFAAHPDAGWFLVRELGELLPPRMADWIGALAAAEIDSRQAERLRALGAAIPRP